MRSMAEQPPATLDIPRDGDAPALAAVHVEVWRATYGDRVPSAFRDATARDRREEMWRGVIALGPEFLCDHVRIVRDREGAPVGFLTVGPGRDEDPPCEMELQALNVLPAFHGTGAAQALVAELLGDQHAYLWVADPNARARAFYEKLGFRIDGAMKTDPALPELREIRMVR